jgi:hypothetical protein
LGNEGRHGILRYRHTFFTEVAILGAALDNYFSNFDIADPSIALEYLSPFMIFILIQYFCIFCYTYTEK